MSFPPFLFIRIKRDYAQLDWALTEVRSMRRNLVP